MQVFETSFASLWTQLGLMIKMKYCIFLIRDIWCFFCLSTLVYVHISICSTLQCKWCLQGMLGMHILTTCEKKLPAKSGNQPMEVVFSTIWQLKILVEKGTIIPTFKQPSHVNAIIYFCGVWIFSHLDLLKSNFGCCDIWLIFFFFWILFYLDLLPFLDSRFLSLLS